MRQRSLTSAIPEEDNKDLDSQREQSSSSVQVDIESSHIDIDEIFFEQDSSMGDRDDSNTGLGGGRNVGPDQEEVMFRQLLGKLEEGQRMQ